MEIKHKGVSAKSIRELTLNPKNKLLKRQPRPPFYSNFWYGSSEFVRWESAHASGAHKGW